MTRESIEQLVIKHLHRLSSKKLEEVLEFIHSLTTKEKPKGKSGKSLLRFSGYIDDDDLKDGCEKIDADEW
jgi:hypothetical protein